MSEFSLKLDDNPSTGDTSSGFAARCKDIFASLDEHKPKAMPSDVTETTNEDLIVFGSGPEPTTSFRGRESIFRVKDSEGFSVPRRPSHRGQFNRSRGNNPRIPHRVAGHVKDPKKYTKYSLADVDLTSDKGNTRAAFDFLRQQREKKVEEENDDSNDEPKKITFKKPVKRTHKEEETGKAEKSTEDGSNLLPTGGASKRVLPECVVGSTSFKSKRQKKDLSVDPEKETEEGESKKKKSKSAPKLSFAFDEDE